MFNRYTKCATCGCDLDNMYHPTDLDDALCMYVFYSVNDNEHIAMKEIEKEYSSDMIKQVLASLAGADHEP